MNIKPKLDAIKTIHKTLILMALFSVSNLMTARNTITGTFPQLAGQTVKLTGFEGLQTYTIATTTVDASGKFTLYYNSRDRGMGYLSAADDKAFFVVLEPEDIILEGIALYLPESVRILSGIQNQLFARYAMEHPKREQALNAWDYLERIYEGDTLFSKQLEAIRIIRKEKSRIASEDGLFLSQLDTLDFISWYLPVRRLISSTKVVAQFRTNEIQQTIRAFRNINYADNKLYKSGLLKDAIESHFWLIENSGQPIDSVFAVMKVSIDYLVPQLNKNEKRLNEVTQYLFDLLERHSLFEASEYLALKILNEVSCTIDNNLSRQLETYRAMKKGNTAPNFTFPGTLKGPSALKISNFYDIKSPFTLVVFGASWCPKCVEELPEIAKKYDSWKQAGVEVLYVSLDDDKDTFEAFTRNFPFFSYCDYQKWKSPVANAYYVFGTPTLFLLDENHKIVLRPNSVKQTDAWVDWYLVRGNKH